MLGQDAMSYAARHCPGLAGIAPPVEWVCRGSCHCGAVGLEVTFGRDADTRKCNCSYCMKTRFWKLFVPAGGFRLLVGEESLREYHFGEGTAAHCFCGRCGTNLFMRIGLDSLGQDFHVVNLACLDDLPVDALAKLPVRYEDGRHDNWWSPPLETKHL